jgi:hypothetical protein
VKCDGGSIAAEQVLMDDHQCVDSDVKDGNIRFFFDVAPGVSRIFSVIYRNEVGSTNLDHGFQRAIKVLLRRRLSEVRDNYLSKTPSLLSVSQSVHRRLSKRLSS